MVKLRDIEQGDWDWLLANCASIGGDEVVAGGFLHRLKDYDAIVAEQDGSPVGFVVFKASAVRWQVLAIVATREGSGIGTALLQELEKRAKAAGAAQVRLSTTNENFTALRFCQMRGYRMRQLIPGAFEEAKKLKGIPSSQIVLGHHDIEIRDEIILNKDL